MLYAVTILLSAFLLFQVQPIIAKMILPWFGGSAAVWTTCMLFFQLLLVGGYAYSHWSIRVLKPRTQTLVHLAFLAVAIAALPILPDASWKPHGEADPSLRILGLLAASVGLPYFLLATTSPLVQAWYARAEHGAMPYRLYALSNLGSMLALVTYPFVFEPWLPTRAQALGWSGAFVVFALSCGALAWRSRTAPAEIPAAADGAAAPPSPGDYALWAGLAAAASILLLAFTSHLSQNVAPVPFLWVLPLALYLLSFILCFEGRSWYSRKRYLPLLAAGFVGVAVTLSREYHNPQLWVMIPLYCVTLFIACMVCHGELARMKPHPRHLTAFFVAISVGGALGGVFVGLVAPRAFGDLWELPVGIVFTAALVAVVLVRDRAGFPTDRGQRAAVAGTAFFTAVLAGALIWIYVDLSSGVRLFTRNFYASLKVYDTGNGPDAMRVLTHGTITHGKQFIDPARRDWPTTYYGENSGVGRAIEAKRTRGPVKIGVIGLGAGTLVAYGRPGDAVRVYELNPQVVDLALKEFTYLGDTKAQLDVIVGDGRLSLEAEPPQNFDVLAVDAFSSDAIPVHLLTAEAFETYFRHLKPGGILTVHISNRYLDLKPVLKEAAAKFGKEARIVEDDSNDEKGTYGTTWVLFADSAAAFDDPPLAGAVEALTAERSIRLWTDDYSDLYAILK
jgi:SAM-dependent methyltransferase